MSTTTDGAISIKYELIHSTTDSAISIKKDIGETLDTETNRISTETTSSSIQLNMALLATPSDSGDIITEYTYDDNGNLINKVVNGQVTEEYVYNLLNQLVSYKDNTKAITATYDYYSDGLRKSKTVNGEKTIFYNNGDNVIIEADGSYNLKARYTIGLEHIRRADSKSNKYYYLFDTHGDVTVLTDSNGQVVKSYDYDIYGNEKEAEYATDIENPIRYTGQYFDEESGLYYLRARYYSPEIMRFISEDTYRGDVSNPLSLNMYIYCQGNPVMLFDPRGNTPEINFGRNDGFSWAYYHLGGESYGDSVNELISIGIGFTPIDGAKDTIDFLAGKDVISGSKVSRLVLLGCIFTPEILDQALKNGVKFSDEIFDGMGKAKPFDIVTYKPSNSPLENHHGIMDAWAKNNIPGYKSYASKSTAIH